MSLEREGKNSHEEDLLSFFFFHSNHNLLLSNNYLFFYFFFIFNFLGEIPFYEIVVQKEISKFAFGPIFQGTWGGNDVKVKFFQVNTLSDSCINSWKKEIKILRFSSSSFFFLFQF